MINRKHLITSVRESKYFSYDSIFDALVYQDFPERTLGKQMKKFRRRGFRVDFDLVHNDIEISQKNAEKRISTFLKRVKKQDQNDLKYVTATHSEPLPLHGLHYFEIMIMPSENQNIANKIFVGL